MEINKLGVLGAGQMGSGIAQVAASVGIQVWINDISDELIAKGIAKITKNLDKLVSKEKIAKDDAEGTASRLHTGRGFYFYERRETHGLRA